MDRYLDGELHIFYEDSMEQLRFMESALLESAKTLDDPEKIGAIFRAMHTIKGSAGMFGFSRIVSFTHIAENVLDKVRSKKITPDISLISVLLESKDYVEHLVDICCKGKEESAESEAIGAKIKESLSIYADDIHMQKDDKKTDKRVEDTEKTDWHVSIRLKKDFFKTGMDGVSLLRYFKKLGTVKKIVAVTEDMPLLDEIDPLSAYIGFEIDFVSACTAGDIEEIFEFVEDDVVLRIFKKNDRIALESLIKEYGDGLKKLLIDEGFYAEELFLADKKAAADKPDKNEIQADKPKQLAASEQGFSLRIDSHKIDNLINKMSEIIIKNAQIAEYASGLYDEELGEMSAELNSLLEDSRDAVMGLRMVQVKDSFVKYKRIVNDVAAKLNKEVAFIVIGEETELDKSVIEKLTDPLTHMIRNAVDHGIESPQERLAAGKSQCGHIFLRAYPDAGTIVIEIEDDGKGINKEAVLKKAVANNIVSQNQELSDKEIYKLIFAAGLSTAKELSDISGRGVGMDVVKKNIEELRGVIDIDSRFGHGTKITVRIPLTLAIIDGFLVGAGGSKYIVPLDMVVECIELDCDKKNSQKEVDTINVRGEVLPLLNIKKFFRDTANRQKDGGCARENAIIVRYGNYRIGLQVDELFGQQQTVIKSLGSIFEKTPGIGGGSIAGDGEVVLILDIPKLISYKTQERGRQWAS